MLYIFKKRVNKKVYNLIKTETDDYSCEVFDYLYFNFKILKKILNKPNLQYIDIEEMIKYSSLSLDLSYDYLYDKDKIIYQTHESLDGLEINDSFYIKGLDEIVKVKNIIRENNECIFIINDSELYTSNPEVYEEYKLLQTKIKEQDAFYTKTQLKEWKEKIDCYKKNNLTLFKKIFK